MPDNFPNQYKVTLLRLRKAFNVSLVVEYPIIIHDGRGSYSIVCVIGFPISVFNKRRVVSALPVSPLCLTCPGGG